MHALLSYASNLDSSLIYAVQSIGPRWEVTAWLLSYAPIALFVVFVIGLVLIGRYRIALELIVITVASVIAVEILKYGFHAGRPYVLDPRVIPYDTDSGYGLPSMHATVSLVVLGWMALRHPKSHIILWGSVILVALIGISRVYLGVHYPSQVLAGWILGALLIYVFRIADKRLWSPFSKTLRK